MGEFKTITRAVPAISRKNWIKQRRSDDKVIITSNAPSAPSAIITPSVESGDSLIVALEAKNTATEAKQIAEAARTEAAEADTVAKEASDVADSAQGTADEAKQIAEAARTAATEAKGNAASANATAQEAFSMADSAQEDAESALARAENAITASNQANTTAEEAKSTAEAARTNATNAASTAQEASDVADSAQGTADEARQIAEAARTEAAEAKGNATSANATAQEAFSMADSAQEDAESALARAENAITASNQAKATAEGAIGAAAAARTEAAEAATAAQEASEKADNAREDADSALGKSESAITSATQANTTAEEAKSTAEAARTTATNAASTAQEASEKADNAQEDADSALAKAESAITSATQANTTAEEAKSTAEEALSKATEAQTAAGDALSKTKGGTVKGQAIFEKPIIGTLQSDNYQEGGFTGSGIKVGFDEDGNAIIEADKLMARKGADFFTVTINQISFTLGETVFSNGGAELTKVEEYSSYYRCFYDTKNGARHAGIQVDDLVRCQYYSADFAKSKYYWRACVLVNDTDGYFDLSKSVADGTGVPEAGDNAVQFGNTSNPARQSAIVIDPLNGGAVSVYSNISGFTLADKNYVGIGVEEVNGKQRAFIYGYGAAYFGDREKQQSYMDYDPASGTLKIKGVLEVGSSGLQNFTEWDDVDQRITDAQQAADDAMGVADAAQKRMNGWVADGVITQMEKQAIAAELAFVIGDYESIGDQAEEYGGASSIIPEIELPYKSYKGMLETIIDALNTEGVESTTANANLQNAQSAYYAARTTALQKIAELAKSLIDAVDKKVSDFDYLKKALPSGAETTIGAGVVLSSVLGVQDAGGNVVAAMIDPKSITDQTDVPYFAAGIGDVKNIATTSKTMISGDGEIQLQDTGVAATSRRKVKLNTGFMKFLLGDNVSLEQTPEEYEATPSADMAFGSFTSEEKSDVTIGLPASFAPFITTKTETFLVKAFDVGEKFTSITVAGGSNVGPLVRNTSGRTYTVNFRLTNESGEYVDGTSKSVGPTGSSTLGVSMYGMYVSGTSANIAKFKNQRVRLELVVTTTEAPGGLVDLTVNFGTSYNKIVIAGNVTTSAYANRLFGNGFFFAKSETQYAGLIVDAENGPVVEFKNDNQGFRFTSAGLKRWHTKLGWIPIDGVIIRGKIYTYGGDSAAQTIGSTTIKNYVDSSTVTTSSLTTADHSIRITLPTTISSKILPSDYMVQLTGLRRSGSSSGSFSGTNGIFASVYAQTNTYFDVYTGDNETENTGGFYFEVKVFD